MYALFATYSYGAPAIVKSLFEANDSIISFHSSRENAARKVCCKIMFPAVEVIERCMSASLAAGPEFMKSWAHIKQLIQREDYVTAMYSWNNNLAGKKGLCFYYAVEVPPVED